MHAILHPTRSMFALSFYGLLVATLLVVVLSTNVSVKDLIHSGDVSLRTGKVDAAIWAYTNAVDLSRDLGSGQTYLSLYKRGIAYLAINDVRRAMLDFERSTKYEPSFLSPYVYLARQQVHRGLFTEASTLCRLSKVFWKHKPNRRLRSQREELHACIVVSEDAQRLVAEAEIVLSKWDNQPAIDISTRVLQACARTPSFFLPLGYRIVRGNICVTCAES
eukprot:Rmarinus@m.28243